MVRPATLDRVENGGPGSDNNPRERKIGTALETERSSGPRSSSLPPCSKLSRRGLETTERVAMAERRPALTASARDGVGNLAVGAEESLRRGRTKESAQSKKVSQQERKRLHSWQRLENEETALGSNKETERKGTGAQRVSPSPMQVQAARGVHRFQTGQDRSHREADK